MFQKQSDSSLNVSLFARQLCYYEDWISISYPLTKWKFSFVETIEKWMNWTREEIVLHMF